MIRVAIIDDHMVVRAGLRYMLESDSEMTLAGEHGGGVGAADFVASVKPDVTLLDVRMPDRNGVDALGDILAAIPQAKVMMLTTSNADEDVFRSIEDGALGYVMKDAPIETILAGIRSVAEGNVFMPDEIRRIYENRKSVRGLSKREAEVLTQVALGLSNRTIGERLGITENSIKMHLKRTYFKLGANDRTEAVQLAVQRGFITSPIGTVR